MSQTTECPYCGVAGGHEPLCLGAVEIGDRPTHENSLKAWQQLLESGRLAGARADFYRAIAEHPRMTATELYRFHLTGYSENTRTRFGELRDLGLIREAGSRKCTITGKTATVWEITEAREVGEPPRTASRLERFTDQLVAVFAGAGGRTWTGAEAADVVRDVFSRVTARQRPSPFTTQSQES